MRQRARVVVVAAAPVRQLMPALALLLCLFAATGAAQRGGNNQLYGDLKVDESQINKAQATSFDLILYTEGGQAIGRQRVANNTRYRFTDLRAGQYQLVIEFDSVEVARLRISLMSPFGTEVRQDINLEWRPEKKENATGGKPGSVVNYYERSAANAQKYEQAQKQIDDRKYEQAGATLKQLLADDPKDYQAWTELGTVYLMQSHADEAEKAYARAVEEKPSFDLALVNLGKLRLMRKNFEGAIEVLDRAVKARPDSAAANYFLGEAYLQIKKGSKAVGYLYEALRLDPAGRAEAHLRLAVLYHGAGMREKAAAEYEQFLVKRPAHPERKKLEQYIADHKKP